MADEKITPSVLVKEGEKTVIKFIEPDVFIECVPEINGRVLEEHTEIINGQKVRVIDRIDNISISLVPKKYMGY